MIQISCTQCNGVFKMGSSQGQPTPPPSLPVAGFSFFHNVVKVMPDFS